MISPKIKYLPFWTLFEYIGDTPPYPFIAVYVLEEYTKNDQNYAKIAIHKPNSELVAEDIPIEMLIDPKELDVWADKIANWFIDHAALIASEGQT